MKRLLIASAAAAILALAAGAAQARDIPAGGLTVPELAAWLQQGGYKAEVKTTKAGDPYISSAAEGVSFEIYMYDCKAGRCASLQLTAGFDLKDPGLPGGAAKINEWNMGKRYLKAYVDSTGDPWAQYDINLSPGETYEGLDDDFKNVWVSGLPEFKKFIGW
jgi:opacity protein-like surface antigen